MASPLLDHCPPGLPAEAYRDPGWYDREQAAIWRKDWVAVGLTYEFAEGTLRKVVLGGASVIVANDKGTIRAFHNVCRHRGAELCATDGPLPRLLTCPYHAWAYAPDGRLVSTAFATPTGDFRREAHGLLPVHVRDWNGVLFLSAADTAPPFKTDIGADALDNWPMARLRREHTVTRMVGCNWKVFWENYNECLHCPNIHPELCDLVPIYGRGIMARRDDPDWRTHEADAAPRVSGGLRDGAESWTLDGAAQGRLPGLTDEDAAAGQRYVTVAPSVFVAHHADYVRAVRVTPLAVDRTEISAEWLFHPDALARPDFDLEKIVAFGKLVMEQDGRACELNQAGLAARGFEHGVLMQEEYEVFLFQDWVRGQLGEPTLGQPAASRASRRIG